MDRVKRFLAHGGKASVICAETTELVEETRKIHDLTPTTTAAMGRFVTICGMMGLTDTKEDDNKITVQIEGRGPVGSLVCSVRREENVSKVKAYIENPHVELPIREDGKLDVGGAVGNNGYLNVVKKNILTDSDYSGLVPLTSGEIAEDFARYFVESEQKPTVLALGVLVDQNGTKASGGYMINLMPDATEEVIVTIENAIKGIPNISNLINEGKSLEEIAKMVTGDENVEEIKENISIIYECDCSREKFEAGLISIGKEELEKIYNTDKKAEIVCHFCNKKYDFTEEDLKKLIDSI